MRALGVVVTIVAAGILFMGASKASAQTRPQRPEAGVQKTAPGDFDLKRVFRPEAGKAKARRSFSHRGKPGEKVAGWCSIDCGNGDGAITWAGDVGDCACQCAGYCGSGCFAWEVYGPGTAYCPAY
jgi:hypothetical protein